MPELTLYHFQSCPYCHKVRTYLASRNIAVPMKDTHASAADKAELLALGGKTQVPCLMIDGQALYESNDIIKWFEEHYT